MMKKEYVAPLLDCISLAPEDILLTSLQKGEEGDPMELVWE